jgi:DNA replication factor GINS
LNGLIELLGSLIISFINRDFEEEEVKAAYIGSPLRIFIEDDYVELVKGAEYTLPRWIARILYENNRVKEVDKTIDETTVARIYFNENRSRGQLKFEKLPGYFYSRVKEQINTMMRTYREITDLSKAHQIVQSITSLSNTTRNLYKTRLSKILSMMGGDIGMDVLADLSEEEKHLYNTLKAILDVFNSKIFEVEKRV